MSGLPRPTWDARLFPNRVRLNRPSRTRDEIAGGTSQGDPTLLGTDIPCSIQQEQDDPEDQARLPVEGMKDRVHVIFTEDRGLKHKDRITDETAGPDSPGDVYVVESWHNEHSQGWVWVARCFIARR